MTNEDKIKKWLAGELSDKEKEEFESSEEFAEINKLMKAVKSFKAPKYDVDNEYQNLSNNVLHKKRTISLYEKISPLMKIAAIFIIVITIGYFSYNYFNSAIENDNWIAEQTEIYLPDSSIVLLNTESRIRFSEKKWNEERNVELKGEAFFKVKKGAAFKVVTEQGTVTVLGTEFNVKEWDNYYEVTCYSGLVNVATKNNSVDLKPNSTFRVLNGKQEQISSSSKSEPGWLSGESSFKSIPFSFVVEELERQYEVSIKTSNIDLNQLFTGSFSHNNLEIALKSITIPLNLYYRINNNQIVITFEDK